uniref:Uncharacterized protein n=1 Tax=Arundo donax TaxID=35708 RepID=A0A0A8XW16_ARUDO
MWAIEVPVLVQQGCLFFLRVGY